MFVDLPIISILTIGFTLACASAYVMQRLRLPAILGYLFAGYIIGPHSPGFVADVKITEQLAEIGVILMLFGVGLHFKLEDLIRVKNIAIPGAILQTLMATVFATLFTYWEGWPLTAGLIIGLSVGVASTVVLVRILTDNNIINTQKGHIAVGWLVVEDIFTVLILILLPTIASVSYGEDISWTNIAGSVLFVMTKFFVLALVMFTWGQRIINYILLNVARIRSQELFTLTIITLVFAIASGSAVVFGTSIALGAFLAGMVIGKSQVRHQASANALPLKDIFAVIFFLSIGMLFNPTAIAQNFGLFAGIICVILIVKPLVAGILTIGFGYSLNVALTVAISLAQIGEFSFILAEQATHLQIMPSIGFDVLVACALISISLNPILFQCIGPIESFLRRFSMFKRHPVNLIPVVKGAKIQPSKVIVIGFGPIGREVSKIAKDAGYVPIIIEQNIDTVSNVEEAHILFGDASESTILQDAHIKEASHLFITIPDTKKNIRIIDSARLANPKIKIASRIQYINERYQLEELHIPYVCTENEAMHAFASLVRHVLIGLPNAKENNESLRR